MRRFFQKIKNSIYSPSFYSSISKSSLGSAIGYFFLLIIFITIIQALNSTYKSYLLNNEENITTIVKTVADSYPSELIVKINNGQVSTNVQEPYFVSLPNDIAPFNQDEELSSILVIDTKTPYSTNQFVQYRSGTWLTKDTLFIRSDMEGSEIKAYDLTKINNLTLNKSLIDSWLGKISPYFKFVSPAIFIFIFIGLYIWKVIGLIYLFIIALLVWILSKIFHKQLTYGQSYKMGLYAITLPLIIEVIVSITSQFTGFSGFTFMFTIATLLMVLINYLLPQNFEIKS